ncbi:CaiB/BaiF CoA transferase family protein [Paludibaculum fermentans]|uniref:CaiB/BaiF CoA transferase family protein n=1 Tax=Paludibaculum fermentans TaxID=1473598 RepID=UPI003EBEBD47
MPDNPATVSPAALHGIRVLDFSHALAGPYCTLLLADFGAEVFKLESPSGGDMGRGWGPPFAGNDSSFFFGLNRGKRGISIDLKRPEGLDLCLRLIDRMDVLIENFRPGTMDRLGLGYAAVALRNPRLVYCSISGYGQAGPSRDEAAMDLIVECSSGFMSITGTEEGEQVRSGYAVADINAGLFSVIGILMALRAREQTGQGQYVDVSMLDAMISAMSSNYMSFLGSGRIPSPLGSGFPTVVPYRVFQARDRAFSIAVGSPKLWVAFCQVIGREDLACHPDYSSNARRVENRHALEATLAAIFREQDTTHWIPLMHSVGIPCSPVRNFQEVVHDPQTALRAMFPVIQCPTAGPQKVTGPAVKLSATPARVGEPAPGLGEHSAAVLSEVLGLSADEIEALSTGGIIWPSSHMGTQEAGD